MAKKKGPKRPKKSTRKQWTAEDVAAVQGGGRPRDAVLKRIKRTNVAKLSKEELPFYNEAARTIIQSRQDTFGRLDFESPALSEYEDKMKRQINAIDPRREANINQEFFRAKTSTLKGAKDWHEQYRAFVFGPNSTEDFNREEWRAFNAFFSDFQKWAGESAVPYQERAGFLVKTGVWLEPDEKAALQHARIRAAAHYNKTLQEFDRSSGMPLSREQIVEKYMTKEYFDNLPELEKKDIRRWIGVWEEIDDNEPLPW